MVFTPLGELGIGTEAAPIPPLGRKRAYAVV